MNPASNVAYVLLNTHKHHHNETLHIFTIFLSIGLFMLYLCDLLFISIFIFIMITRIIP